MGCSCGGPSKSGGTGQKYYLIDTSGAVVKTYSSETDARMAASQNAGFRVRPA